MRIAYGSGRESVKKGADRRRYDGERLIRSPDGLDGESFH